MQGIATGDAVSCDSKAAATSSAADVEDDVQCKAELTLRLFGKEESLCAREVPEEDEECRADLTQRLFGAGDSLGAPPWFPYRYSIDRYRVQVLQQLDSIFGCWRCICSVSRHHYNSSSARTISGPKVEGLRFPRARF